MSVDWTVPYANLGLLIVKNDFDPNAQAIGDCPFCERENHFFINQATGLWDCKLCMEAGNFIQFLTAFTALGIAQTSRQDYQELEDAKGIPRSVLRHFDVCRHPLNPHLWLLPAKSTTASVVNLYQYSLKDNKSFGVKGIGHSLIGLEHYTLKDGQGRHVYICEGQWDTYAMTDLVAALPDANATDVIGVPGAGVFSPAWARLFVGRHVHLVYDNDEPGRKGMSRAAMTLLMASMKPLSVSKIQWPRDAPEGCDIRNLYLDPDGFAGLLSTPSPVPPAPPRRPKRPKR